MPSGPETGPRPRGQRDLSCEEARELLTRFLEEALPRREDRALRRHLPGCADCRRRYTEMLSVAAGLGRTLRERRVEEERVERRRTQRRLALGSSTALRDRRLKFLRPMLWSALIVFLMFQFTHVLQGPDPLAVEVERGTATIAGEPLDVLNARGEVDRGEWCSTGLDSRLAIEADDAELALGSRSQLMVDGVDPLRVRLETGELAASGACTIVTVLGAVEVDGTVRIALLPGELAVECLAGSVSVVRPTGAEAVPIGTTVRFGRPWEIAGR